MPVLFRTPGTARLDDGTVSALLRGSGLGSSRLEVRDETDADAASIRSSAITHILAAVFVAVVVLLTTALVLRTCRARHANPKYVPTPFLKRAWAAWNVPSHRSRSEYQQTGGEDSGSGNGSGSRSGNAMMRRTSTLQANLEVALGASRHNGSTAPRRAGRTEAPVSTAPAAAVDRNASVRSVMTLPAYRPKAAEHERVLGREGERDGIDVVVEMPTAEAEEAMREQEMDALYQIRLARRRHLAEREQRRQLRQQARDANNTTQLSVLRERARSDTSRYAEELDDLRMHHERVKDDRQHAVSSVSYAELGVVRADGTRLRANSTGSTSTSTATATATISATATASASASAATEHVSLLSDAASISQQSTHAGSLLQRRDRSLSVLSIDTSRSNDPLNTPSPGLSLTTQGSPYHMPTWSRVRARSTSGSSPDEEASGSEPGSRTRSRSRSRSRSRTRTRTRTRSRSRSASASASARRPPPGYEDVNLAEMAPVHARSTSSPYSEPPPDYPGPGPAQVRSNRLSAQMDDLAAGSGAGAGAGAGAMSMSNLTAETDTRLRSSLLARLPSLRLSELPQIVIEPWSARPAGDE